LFGTYSGGTSGTLLQGGTSTDYSVRVAGKLRQNISTGGDISFYEDTGTTPKFFWDASAESLGIGTASPLGVLSTLSNDTGVVFQTSASSNKRMQLLFKDNGGTNTARIGNDISGDNTSQLQFIAGSGSTPQVTLDSSGNFMVSTTDNTLYDDTSFS